MRVGRQAPTTIRRILCGEYGLYSPQDMPQYRNAAGHEIHEWQDGQAGNVGHHGLGDGRQQFRLPCPVN